MGNCCINLSSNNKELYFSKDKNYELNKREDKKNMTIKKYIENNDNKNKNINININTKIYSLNSSENEKYKSKKILNYLNKKNNESLWRFWLINIFNIFHIIRIYFNNNFICYVFKKNN
jgi:hypothetical protein